MKKTRRSWWEKVRQPRVFMPAMLGMIAAGTAVTYAVLLNPGGTIMRWFQAKPPLQFSTITIGPYPQEEDFARLKKEGVKYIVTLLHPEIPYEKPMLEQEEVLAKKNGIILKSFPLFPVDSMLNTDLFPESAKEEEKAVDFLQHVDGRAYVHCYLGRHRALRVRAALIKAGVPEEYFEGTPIDSLSSEAWKALRDKEYAKVLQILEPVKSKDADVTSLRGWAHYRLGLIDDAAQDFSQGLEADPSNPRNLLGLGYCYLRKKQPVMAQRQFAMILEQLPDNREALVGIGLAHLHLRNKDVAARIFRKLLEGKPGNEEVRGYLKQAESP